MIAVETGIYLGPASVLEPPDPSGHVLLQMPAGDTCHARLALALPYAAAAGDEVLVIWQAADSAYIIGVLKGKGATTLRVPGDLKLEAPNGAVKILAGTAMKLKSGEGMEFSAPSATVRVSRFNVVASTVVHRVTSMFTWASGLVQTKSERLRQLSEKGWFIRAGRGHIKTADNISINGKTIHLG